MTNVYTFKLTLDWKLINQLSQLDRFDASWTSIEIKEGQSLNQLKSIATIESVGASTRIEGSRMTDAEVDTLLANLTSDNLTERDAQEVAGYFDVFEIISEAYVDIGVSQSAIKGLHNKMLKYSEKDQWHKGDYKQHSNNVEATMADGSKHIVFNTTPPGFETNDAMRGLVQWFKTDSDTHPIIKAALFSYEFVTIHPFQDGNGRLSRLLAALLLLKSGYRWIRFVSLEHEIEKRKAEYYRVLRSCQAQRPQEDISDWVLFFLDALKSIQQKLDTKLQQSGIESMLSPRQKLILTVIANYPGCKSGIIADKLDIPNPTVKRQLRALVEQGLIEKHGIGPGTNYSLS